jgi:hypothetical protein
LDYLHDAVTDRPRTLATLVLTALALLPSSLRADDADCDPASGISTCVDASPLWLPAGRPRFLAITPGALTPERAFAFGAAFSYASRPIVLVAQSPDPEGREIRVIDHRVDAALLWAYSPLERLELTLATPMVLHQTGAGAAGVTSQSAPPIAPVAAGDPRVGAGYALAVPDPMRAASGLAVKAKAELSLPLGDEQVFAGEDTFVFAPGLAASVEHGVFFAGAELGMRLRKTAHVATASLGTQLLSALGAGIHILSDEKLSFGAEAWLMPTLVAQDRARGDALLVPAEWLASLRSAPLADRAFLLQLGGGTGIPLSSQAGEDQLGVTTPRFRIVFAIRYAPRNETP